MERYWKAFYMPLQSTLERIIAFVPRFGVAAALFLLFYGLASLSRKTISRSLKKVTHIPWAVRVLVARSVYFLMLFTGLLVALSAINVNVTTLITSLGVAGFALGFALKDILENFISGILLLFARPFEVGDQVTLGEFAGTVQNIEIRTTTLQSYTGEAVTIPNSKVYTNAVINHTRTGRRCYQINFDTSLSASQEVVERETLAAAQENVEILDDPAPTIRVTKIDSGSDVLSWRLSFWAAPSKAVETKTISEMLEAIKRVLYDNGVPTPTSTSEMILRRATLPSAAPQENASSVNALHSAL